MYNIYIYFHSVRQSSFPYLALILVSVILLAISLVTVATRTVVRHKMSPGAGLSGSAIAGDTSISIYHCRSSCFASSQTLFYVLCRFFYIRCCYIIFVCTW
ncbi:hypothetical protein K469DRAFT_260318 [Zopfia rhizophila CBS 207.26]|uniref:Uncharacterized protein n=1 Tax=Zopfia rhizophila CBS 207.26 TaxID=1314779 RepID=A0A6A6DT55_9PEZI|nr:hypothetical protein K469DRAFT_260318 [Zopfia rhizophila CBS 207.26]